MGRPKVTKLEPTKLVYESFIGEDVRSVFEDFGDIRGLRGADRQAGEREKSGPNKAG